MALPTGCCWRTGLAVAEGYAPIQLPVKGFRAICPPGPTLREGYAGVLPYNRSGAFRCCILEGGRFFYVVRTTQKAPDLLGLQERPDRREKGLWSIGLYVPYRRRQMTRKTLPVRCFSSCTGPRITGLGGLGLKIGCRGGSRWFVLCIISPQAAYLLGRWPARGFCRLPFCMYVLNNMFNVVSIILFSFG